MTMMTNVRNFVMSMILGAVAALCIYVPVTVRNNIAQAAEIAAEPQMVAYLGNVDEGDVVELAQFEEEPVPLAAFPCDTNEKSAEQSFAKIELPNGTVYEGNTTEEAGAIVLDAMTATIIIDGENVAVYEADMVDVYAQTDCILAMR